jgi:hypothetical protein
MPNSARCLFAWLSAGLYIPLAGDDQRRHRPT